MLVRMPLMIGFGCMAGMAQAEPITSSEARKVLFRDKGRTGVVNDHSFIGQTERAALEQYAGQFDYYAAMAVSPGDPAESGSAVALANFHSLDAAEAAALAGCEARRQTGRECVIVATVAPRKYDARPLTLSVEATVAVRGDYRKLDAPKAFAVSPSTGAWAFARGDGARALAQCSAKAGEANDCRVVIAD